MAVKKYKPTSPGQRGMTGYTFEEITKSVPERSLTVSLGRHGGRNSYGRVTVRHRGGGNRRLVRVVDFKRNKFGIPAKVAAINMIQTVPPGLLCFIMQTAKRATYLLPLN